MIGILGGTFDPVHYGHLRIALELLQGLPLDEVRFMPCHVPPHREGPVASAQERLAMLELAIAAQPGFVVDKRELERPGLSYMVDTLNSLRESYGNIPLCLILGRDAFNKLDTWHCWRRLIELAHIVVACRPGVSEPPSPAVTELLETCQETEPRVLRQRPGGNIVMWPVTQLAISATGIRAMIGEGKSPRYLMPDCVWSHIQKKSLYR